MPQPCYEQAEPQSVRPTDGPLCRSVGRNGTDPSAAAVLWSGAWQREVRRDGRPPRPRAAWEAVCRFSDRDVDYLELAVELAGGLRIERHMVLGRTDRFLLLADAVLGDRPARLQYCGRLPLGPAVTLRRTQEGPGAASLFAGPKRLATFALGAAGGPAPRAANCRQETLAEPVASSAGAALVCSCGRRPTPAGCLRRCGSTWIAAAPRRLTWRPLSVGQAMQVQTADTAVGFRVAVGRSNGCVYRSLAEPGNRTLLGHNLTSETLVARFHPQRPGRPLIEIE